MAWLSLACALTLCLPPLLVDLGGRVSTHTMENVALVVSQETWLRWHEGEASAWLVTTNDGIPRLQKPPMLTWINFAAWADLSPQTATPVELTYRARLATAALALMMLASIFWMGCTLADLRLALVASLAAGSMWFFQRQARCASYDMHFVAWATLAVAAGLWAMKPRPSANSRLGDDSQELAAASVLEAYHRAGPGPRWIVGWTLCGVAMAASVLSKNPLAFAIAVVPLVAALVLNPAALKPNLIGLLAAVALALVPVGLWYAHIGREFPDAASTLAHEFSQPRQEPQPIYYYIGVLALVLPWPIWLICGLFQPFDARVERAERRRTLIAWSWFVMVLILFSIPQAKQQRYILPIIPATALLIGWVVRRHDEHELSVQRDPLGAKLGEVMWIALLIASPVLAAFLAGQEWLVTRWPRFYPQQMVHPMSWLGAATLAAVLLATVAIGWRCHARRRPIASAVAVALWALIATTTFWSRYSEVPTRVDQYKSEAERAAQIVSGRPLRSLRVTRQDHNTYILNEEFRFYFGRLIHRIGPEELEAYSERSASPVYVLAKRGPAYARPLRQAGFRELAQVHTDQDDVQDIWVK